MTSAKQSVQWAWRWQQDPRKHHHRSELQLRARQRLRGLALAELAPGPPARVAADRDVIRQPGAGPPPRAQPARGSKAPCFGAPQRGGSSQPAPKALTRRASAKDLQKRGRAGKAPTWRNGCINAQWPSERSAADAAGHCRVTAAPGVCREMQLPCRQHSAGEKCSCTPFSISHRLRAVSVDRVGAQCESVCYAPNSTRGALRPFVAQHSVHVCVDYQQQSPTLRNARGCEQRGSPHASTALLRVALCPSRAAGAAHVRVPRRLVHCCPST